jgi:hypothetical protein
MTLFRIRQSNIANDFSKDLPGDLLDEISFVYFPQLGYLVRTQPPISSEVLEEVLGPSSDFQARRSVSSLLLTSRSYQTRSNSFKAKIQRTTRLIDVEISTYILETYRVSYLVRFLSHSSRSKR